jgi:hypothetical protein
MRRKIKFNSWQEIEEEFSILEQSGRVETSGVWSFYQILKHINDALHYSMNGFPNMKPAIIRKTIGRIALSYFMKRNEMRAGLPNSSAPKKREEGDERVMFQKLKATLKEYKEFQGEFAPHTIFGDLTREEWDKLHLMHFSLHLSFAHPDKTTQRKLTSPAFPIIEEDKLELVTSEIKKEKPQKTKSKVVKKPTSKKKTKKRK